MATDGDEPLDNVVWRALTSHQAPIAQGDGRARRYPPELSVFAAIESADERAWADLATIVGPGGVAVLFRPELPSPPRGWRELQRGRGNQFVAHELAPAGHVGPELTPLGPGDAEAMLALATLTKPGPFVLRTSELGRFVGVVEQGRLVAMAGERFHLTGYTEISAVCTHPDARGRGLAAYLTHHVANLIVARGETPMLHVAEGNDDARRVYERLGFTLRTPVEFAALKLEEVR